MWSAFYLHLNIIISNFFCFVWKASFHVTWIFFIRWHLCQFHIYSLTNGKPVNIKLCIFYFSWAAMCLKTMFLCNLVLLFICVQFSDCSLDWVFIYFLDLCNILIQHQWDEIYWRLIRVIESFDFIYLALLWRWRLLESCDGWQFVTFCFWCVCASFSFSSQSSQSPPLQLSCFLSFLPFSQGFCGFYEGKF